MNSPARSYRCLFWTMALLGLIVDQTSKYWVFAAFYGDGRGGEQAVVPGVLSFQVAYPNPDNADPGDGFLYHLRTLSAPEMPFVNQGALWGFKMGSEGSTANTLFAVVSAIAAVAIIFWSALRKSATEGWLCFALGLILAGAVGNLYDRVVFLGVRDFLHFDFLQFDWFKFATFNVADSCLVCGAGALLVQAFFFQPQEQDKPVATTVPPAPATSSTPEAVSTE